MSFLGGPWPETGRWLNLLDTGLTYRAVAHALLRLGLPLDNVSAAETAARCFARWPSGLRQRS
jgi:cytidylate kinase